MVNFINLNWDSDFFGFKVARLKDIAAPEIKAILDDLSSRGYRLAVLYSGEGDQEIRLSAVENKGFLADKKVTYARTVPKLPLTGDLRTGSALNIRVNPPELKPEYLFDLAYLAGNYSRFRKDKNFPSGAFERLYAQWVINSLNGEFADYTLVHYDDKGIGGFSTLKTDGDMARIGLISVDTNRQNQGIGKALIIETIKICISNCINTIEVDTQSENVQACKFYEKSGFSVKEVKYIHHFWLKQNLRNI
jgi:dTDP-4-amino-4,6-dideoxy-D-galactose acyltransferase